MRSFRNEDGKYFHISYYLVFCPRYRRKIFTIDKLEVRFKEMVHAVCDSHNISVTDISCGPDYCYISINVPPNISAAGAIAKIKGYTGRRLLEEVEEFSKTPNIWTRNYLVSTKSFSQKEIDSFVEKQVTHY